MGNEEPIPISFRQPSFSSLQGVIITKGGEKLESVPDLFSCSTADYGHSTSTSANSDALTHSIIKSKIQRQIAIQQYSSCSSFFGQDEEEDYNPCVIMVKQLAISNGERWDNIGYKPKGNILESVRNKAMPVHDRPLSHPINLPIIEEDEILDPHSEVQLDNSSTAKCGDHYINQKAKPSTNSIFFNQKNISANNECLCKMINNINELESQEDKKYRKRLLELDSKEKEEIMKAKPKIEIKTNSIIEDLSLCIESAIAIGNKEKAYSLIAKLQDEEHKLNSNSNPDYILLRKNYAKKKRAIKRKYSKKREALKASYLEIKKSFMNEKTNLQTAYKLHAFPWKYGSRA